MRQNLNPGLNWAETPRSMSLREYPVFVSVSHRTIDPREQDPLLSTEYEQSTGTIDTREFYTPEGRHLSWSWRDVTAPMTQPLDTMAKLFNNIILSVYGNLLICVFGNPNPFIGNELSIFRNRRSCVLCIGLSLNITYECLDWL